MKNLSLIACILFSGGCSGLVKDKNAADAAVSDFHILYNQGKFDEIYENAGSQFRISKSRDEFLGLMSALKRQSGEVTATSNFVLNLQTHYDNLSGTISTVTQEQHTTFERGSGDEKFVFVINGDKAVLINYNISSNEDK